MFFFLLWTYPNIPPSFLWPPLQALLIFKYPVCFQRRARYQGVFIAWLADSPQTAAAKTVKIHTLGVQYAAGVISPLFDLC